jgi:hypothetical protein
VASAPRPSHSTRGITSMLGSGTAYVKGAATEASTCDSEMPTCAARSAMVSFAPSPTMPTYRPIACSASTSAPLSSGLMRAKTPHATSARCRLRASSRPAPTAACSAPKARPVMASL